MDGKGAYLTQVRCGNHSTKRRYKVTVEWDATSQPTFEDFVELDMMLEAAGHARIAYKPSAIITMPRIMVELIAHENSYRVGAVYKADGKTKVTRAEALQAQSDKRKARQDSREDYVGLSTMQQIALVQKRKQDAHIAALEAKHAKHFGDASKALMAWFLDKPYMPESAAA
jgi:hypothetical protein